ncbi:poly(A) RNA polymerase, mitochondrial isoform X2 [Esox lucius]|uniref:RL domain-containing protein n=1 Tax=Esox lucius TaxID=8010 RepID=A0A3P8XDM1_ESOLU|nr:poly(A) RNA polymerase, mitochondrial isoform X2 [Esox lucius]
MAASIAVIVLHMRGRGCFSKCFPKLHSCFQRKLGISTAAMKTETTNKKDEIEPKGGVKSFYTVQEERMEQAERSVLISCPSKTNEKKFMKYLSRHGDINKCFFYESYGTYAVVEFAHKESLTSLHQGTAIPSVNHEAAVPFKSRLLSLKNTGSLDQSSGQSAPLCQPQTTVPMNDLILRLSNESSIDQQISSLTEMHQLTEENVCLRYLVCSLLKDIAAAYFPECKVRPFGSSVNGFGKLGCDLDMFLDLDGISGRSLKKLKAGFSLEYQTKRSASERAVTQSILSVIGECVDQFGPGCVGVQKILQARCPLVRFAHQPSGFQCDLTANNRVAMKSTELLYLCGGLDWRRRTIPILPTLDYLKELAGPLDKCVIDGNDCTFVSDVSKIRLQDNTETLEQLLQEFFEFYGSFAFNRMSINIRKGREQNKSDVSPLHIQNPFDASLNVSKNVNATQLERFVGLCRESAWMLQQREFNAPPANGAAGGTKAPWGLAALLSPSVSQAAGVKSRRGKKREPASERIKSLLESLKDQGGKATSLGAGKKTCG